MSQFKMSVGGHLIAISGYAPNQPVKYRNGYKIHYGLTAELTLTHSRAPTKRITIPFPLTPKSLAMRCADYNAILIGKDLKQLHDALWAFIHFVSENHGLDDPYRPAPADSRDCLVRLQPVTATGNAGAAQAEEFVESWFPPKSSRLKAE